MTTLDLYANAMGDVASQYFADALKTNSVIPILINIIFYFIFNLQTLVTLNFLFEKMGPVGAKHFTDALTVNKVF